MARDQIIKTTAGDIAAELDRRGIASDETVVVLVRLGDWLADVREKSRARVVAAGLDDDDIDRLIEQAREEVQLLIK